MKGVQGQSTRELPVVSSYAQKDMWTPDTAGATEAGIQTEAGLWILQENEWVQPFYVHGWI